MGRHTSHAFLTVGLLLLAATAWSMAQPPEPAEPTLPATDINRESNNPAKEAIRAKEAQEKDKAKQAAVQESAKPVAGPVSDAAQLVRSVESALRNDTRTAQLGIQVRVDEQDQIGLHGSVPTTESRNAVIDVAAKVAGAARVKNHLVVGGKK
jgi:osmotically-inducible protein OsmY